MNQSLPSTFPGLCPSPHFNTYCLLCITRIFIFISHFIVDILASLLLLSVPHAFFVRR